MYRSPRIWLFYLFLFLLAVPWYWRWLPVNQSSVWLGMPAWVVVSILGSLVISIYTACLLRRPWRDEQADAVEERPG